MIFIEAAGVPGVLHVGDTTIVSDGSDGLVAEIDVTFEPLIDMDEEA